MYWPGPCLSNRSWTRNPWPDRFRDAPLATAQGVSCVFVPAGRMAMSAVGLARGLVAGLVAVAADQVRAAPFRSNSLCVNQPIEASNYRDFAVLESRQS